MDRNRAFIHYAGLSLLTAIIGIIWLTNQTLTYEGNDIAQAGILIGILGSVVTGVLGFMSGLVFGKHIESKEEDA